MSETLHSFVVSFQTDPFTKNPHRRYIDEVWPGLKP